MLAVFGGSFDPIHFGHIRLALQVQEVFEFEEFMFLPCGQPPHKEQLLFSQTQRLEMLRVALQEYPHMSMSDFEFNGKVSYTIDTLRHFHATQQPICFIMGSDSFNDLPNWEYYQEFKHLTNILVIDRSNTTTELFGFKKVQDIQEFKHSVGSVYFFKNKLINISSTEIRSKIHNLENIDTFVPKNIINLINEYRTNTTN